MAGLYGYLANGNNKAILLDGNLMAHTDRDVMSEVVDDEFQAGCVSHLLYNNAVVDEGSLVLSFYGEVFGVINDNDTLSVKTNVRNAGDLKKLLYDIKADRESFLQTLDRTVVHLNGAFVIVLYDRSSKRLTIYNDRFGLYPMYYMEREGAFYYSQEAKLFKSICELVPDYVLMKNIENGKIAELLNRQRKSDNGLFRLSPFGGSVDELIRRVKEGNGSALTVLKNMVHFSLINELLFDGRLDIYYNDVS